MSADPYGCRFFPLGDQAVLVEMGTTLTPALNDRVHALSARLLANPLSGVLDIVPAYVTLAVHYDAGRIAKDLGQRGSPREAVLAWVEAELSGLQTVPRDAGRRIEIPVCYGGEWGEDLGELAQAAGLSAEEFAGLHGAGEYRVHLVGFAPGFAYLGGLDARLHAPRRASPRARVPAGSVAIGGEQTGVYPLESPGGWNLIGRTPLRMFDPARDPACLLAAGDRVTFLSIDRTRFDALCSVGN
jgi:inhibitor of KinA